MAARTKVRGEMLASIGTGFVLFRVVMVGRVRGWADFGHPFAMTVTGVKTVVENDQAPLE